MITAKKRDFLQHTSKYLNMVDKHGCVIITHHNKPSLKIVPIKEKTIADLRGLITKVKIKGDINQHVIEGYDKWC